MRSILVHGMDKLTNFAANKNIIKTWKLYCREKNMSL